mmetsp:Transcript_27076/g.30898  ORF Transcript_27076/g.30898 Transcript_27076/m.30898 type:complete len:292 (-) Transcript_27076:136-1011(-)|eukprot:CAMPEP_0194146700 /NCGR_PEP_ID=MMETSP0152-20130528/21375_1 /TAXON_ID=1049557 /ORGANISM="Thalassiothrix antarctica, Strain L6-D1" /LENGTH=291 /DNA_ID=CAMNT_0038847279 /DNA_START=150 /DNA_END=1025 /DNA_ORIENTATION=+
MTPYGSTNTVLYPISVGVSRKTQKGLSTSAGLQPNTVRGGFQSSVYKPSPTYKQESPRGKRRTVVFSHVSIRLYDRTLGDNPCCNGAPLTLEWEYAQKEPDYIEDYENMRKTQRRSRRELSIPLQRRKFILHGAGVSEEDIIKREAELIEIRYQMLIARANYGGFRHREPTVSDDNKNDANSAVLPRVVNTANRKQLHQGKQDLVRQNTPLRNLPMRENVSPVKQVPTSFRENTPPMRENTQLMRKNTPVLQQRNASSIRQVPNVTHTILPMVRPVTRGNRFMPKEQEMEC